MLLLRSHNKEFLETNYPRGRPIGGILRQALSLYRFRSFHFDPTRPKTEILCLYSRFIHKTYFKLRCS